MNFFTSDTHFGHQNIIKYANRPFSSVKEMDEVLIAKWNNKVKSTDTVYFLGDFCFKRCAEAPDGFPFEYYRTKLNGSIVFIQGNHDKSNGFRPILQAGVIEFGGHHIYLVHKPEHMNTTYPLGFVGHVHDHWKFMKVQDSIMINVGVDQWQYEPIHIHQINKELAKWKRKNGKVS